MAVVTTALLRQRIVAAIRGAFIADAATMGVHWWYQPSELLEKVLSADEPEFRTPALPNFYSEADFPGHYKAGMLSPYGEQMLFVTEHTAAKKAIDGKEMSTAMADWASSYGGRNDHATKELLKNVKELGKTYPDSGADDDQAHCFMKIIPVTCLYAGKKERQAKVEEAIRVHQNTDRAVAFGLAASQLLEDLLMGKSIPEAVENLASTVEKEDTSIALKEEVATAMKRINEASMDDLLVDLLKVLSNEKMKDNPDSPMYDIVARACGLPFSFMGPFFLLKKVANKPDAYVAAVRENILASGDNCSRAILIGALVGAASGEVPASWIEKVDADLMKKIDNAANAIADAVVVPDELKASEL